MQITVELPDEIAEQIHKSSGDIGPRMLEAFASEGYRSGNLTGWQLQQLLDLKNRFEVDAFLKRAGVFREYTVEELERDYQMSRRASQGVQSRAQPRNGPPPVTVIADTSPIHYGVMIGTADAFFLLYGQILVPSAVYAELMDSGAPIGMHQWVEGNRSRIQVRSVETADDRDLRQLDAGGREAIALAQQFTDSLLIIDEKAGRIAAEGRGIHITGLLGVIRDAGIRGHLDFELAIDRLKATDFRLSPEVETLVRRQFRSSR